MLFKVYGYGNDTGYSMELDDLTAVITSCNTAGESEIEYLKAFAVMARTELARKTFIYNGKGCEKHKGYDICTEPGHCLEYGFGNIEISQSVYDAVASTEGVIMLLKEDQ